MSPFLIGLAGRAGSGKDSVGRAIVGGRGYGTKLIAFAEPLKRICQEIYAFSDDQMVDHRLKEAGDARYRREDGTLLSPREAMQRLGTEWGRACYPSTWVDYGIRRAKRLIQLDHVSVVFTDCRFINEVKAIREADGEVWRIRRPSADAVPALHVSETEMDTLEFEKYVNQWVLNDGSLEQLGARVRALLP